MLSTGLECFLQSWNTFVQGWNSFVQGWKGLECFLEGWNTFDRVGILSTELEYLCTELECF
jgi:hypothetical protein